MHSNQQVTINDKNRIEVDAVISVRALDADGVLLETSFGDISVEGSDLKMENFEKSSSKILITGNISGVYYLQKRMKKKGRGVLN